ncbi:hypothetical protein MR829_08165 [Paracoccus versutus]|uniref:DUF6680 family protein n=1 Tax=Paracoccus versutus TaxID=34007 RepID=UPI001FB79F1B|nr:DUF6680 family protein [Paracoccus versutus]MCJ1900350.1 hypothetical protein [Paracoccus versutus]
MRLLAGRHDRGGGVNRHAGADGTAAPVVVSRPATFTARGLAIIRSRNSLGLRLSSRPDMVLYERIGVQMMEWAIVLATFVGPIAAVAITLWYQRRSKQSEVRFNIYVAMMRNRRNMLNPDFVGSFNLVPVYFGGNAKVMEGYREVLRIVNDPSWTTDTAKPRLFEQLNDAASRLLHSISAAVGAPVEQLDILNGAYAPQAWLDDAAAQIEVRDLLRAFLQGKRPLPVIPLNNGERGDKSL